MYRLFQPILEWFSIQCFSARLGCITVRVLAATAQLGFPRFLLYGIRRSILLCCHHDAKHRRPTLRSMGEALRLLPRGVRRPLNSVAFRRVVPWDAKSCCAPNAEPYVRYLNGSLRASPIYVAVYSPCSCPLWGPTSELSLPRLCLRSHSNHLHDRRGFLAPRSARIVLLGSGTRDGRNLRAVNNRRNGGGFPCCRTPRRWHASTCAHTT